MAAAAKRSGEKMTPIPVLVLCDDLWHPAEVIERGLAALPPHPYQFDIVKTAKDILTPDYLDCYPAIICCKSNCINQGNHHPWFEEGVSEVMPKDFKKYVEQGHGFLSLHSGLVYGPNDRPDFAELTGAAFLGHPPRCSVRFHVADPEHPVAHGVEDFISRDEHYQMDVTAKDLHLFLTSSSEAGGTQAAGYTRQIGCGRLCVLTPGHTLAVWTHPQFQRLLLNALSWCLDS